MSQLTLTTQLLERLSPDEARVWDVLQEYRGKASAITNRQIAKEAQLPVREVRWCIKTLTEDHHKSIGSLPGLGVFLITSIEERQEVLDFYRHHALSLLRRMCQLSLYGTADLMGQVRMELSQIEKELSGEKDSQAEP